MVVLVNRYSASASEIVSACLQDHHRAIVIGERTWGKGSVQNVIELEGGKSALKLTTASYQRPSGKNIHRFPDASEADEWGVKPDSGYDLKLDDAETIRVDDLSPRSRHIAGESLPGQSTARGGVDRRRCEERRPNRPWPLISHPPISQATQKPVADKPAAEKPAVRKTGSRRCGEESS